jgi:prepilin-type N-terminal cleavage/methylation domain-containing protein
MNKLQRHRSEQGFTIIELLIATAVFSTILVAVSAMMIKIGNLYYKGINQSRIQHNVRNITDEIASQLKLSDATSLQHPSLLGSIQVYCIGSLRYTYILNREIPFDNSTGVVTAHALWRDTTNGSCVPNSSFPSNPDADPNGSNGIELVASHARLTQLDISSDSPYTITVALAYGDSDLLTPDGKRCRGQSGDQFCATAHLTTSAVRRVGS